MCRSDKSTFAVVTEPVLLWQSLSESYEQIDALQMRYMLARIAQNKYSAADVALVIMFVVL
jgi:hypothetical protein